MKPPIHSLSILTRFIALGLAVTPYAEVIANVSTVDDLVGSDALYWLVIISVTFVQGSSNALFTLFLRRYRFEESGYRWTEAFWAGFPIAFFCAVFVNGLNHIRTLSALSLSLHIALFLILNGVGVYIIGKWASRE